MTKQKVPVQKNDIVTVEIKDLTHRGSGVGKVEHYPLFIPNVIPGETVEIKVVKANKRYGYGRLKRTLKASPERVSPPCNVFYKCGGCQLQHMSYKMQLKMKEDQVRQAIKKIARLSDVTVHPTIGMKDPWVYRNKIQMPVGEKDGELITGFYQPRSHNIIHDMEKCIIQDERGDTLVETVRKIATKLGITAYDEVNHTGILRHIIVRTTYKTNELMLILVTRTNELPHQDELINRLRKKFPTLKSIIHNINSEKTNVILGEKMKKIYGDDYIIDTINNLKFKISPRSFFQVNPEQTVALYQTALKYANVDKNDIVIDAYCGLGSISLFLAQKAKRVYGIEIVPEAIKNAKENAHLNDIDNAQFVVGKAEEVMPLWSKKGLKPDVIVIDPPRKGCDEVFLQAMVEMQPNRIVYVSCNPATLARDLRILADGGYETKEVQPVDMFAQTAHVEAVAVLYKKDG